MTYTILIDQQFAIDNDLSLVQVSTLAAFMTLPMWSETIAIDGKVWYRYSDTKMSEDFPLLFGVPKRCYKNISDLVALGFVELIKIGNDRYVNFTAKCSSWNRKDRNWTNSPKTDQQSENGLNGSPKMDEKQSENGRNGSPKMDANYIINNDYNINTIELDNKENNAVHSRSGHTHDSESEKNQNLFSQNELDAEVLNAIVEIEPKRKEKSSAKREKKSTRESLCLFENSRFAEYEDFKACFSDEQYSDIDLYYYYSSVKDWSSSRAKMRNDWIATARNFMRIDADEGKLKKISERLAKDNRKIAEAARKTEAMNRSIKDLEDYFNGLNQ